MGDLLVFSKHPHRRGCHGALYGTGKVVYTDCKGRIGNGGKVTQEFVCNCRWDGCEARVLVSQAAVLRLARSVEVRPRHIGRPTPDDALRELTQQGQEWGDYDSHASGRPT